MQAVKAAFLQLPMLDAARERPDAASLLKQMSEESHAWHLDNQDPAMWAAGNAVDGLTEIEVPALVVIGGRDALDVQLLGDRLAEQLPKATKALMDNIGHLPNVDEPVTCNNRVGHFLDAQSFDGDVGSDVIGDGAFWLYFEDRGVDAGRSPIAGDADNDSTALRRVAGSVGDHSGTSGKTTIRREGHLYRIGVGRLNLAARLRL